MDTTLRADQALLLNEHYELVHMPYGDLVVNAHDPVIKSHLNDTQAEITNLCQFALGTVLDIGANIGSHAINYAKRADIVYAFEPQPDVYFNLCCNLMLNTVHNVRPFKMAISSECGATPIPHLDPTKRNSPMGVAIGEGSHIVPMTTLDALDLQADFMKIDVEGHELEVLKGARETLARESPIVYCEIHREELLQPIFEVMDGYERREYVRVCYDNYGYTYGYLFWKKGRIIWQ